MSIFKEKDDIEIKTSRPINIFNDMLCSLKYYLTFNKAQIDYNKNFMIEVKNIFLWYNDNVINNKSTYAVISRNYLLNKDFILEQLNKLLKYFNNIDEYKIIDTYLELYDKIVENKLCQN